MSEPDYEARTMARQAIAKIEAHEDVCAVRWKSAHSMMTEVKAAQKMQTMQMWAAQSFVVVLLLAIVGWLLPRAFH